MFSFAASRADDSFLSRNAIMGFVRQLITRVDDDLHARLKAIAQAEGRSLNSLVTEALEHRAERFSARDAFRARLRKEGRLVEIDVPDDAPSLEEVREMLRGDAGRAILEALEEDRADRV